VSADWSMSTGIVLGGAVAALALILAGAIVLLRAAFAFADRLGRSVDLPFADQLAELDTKFARLQRRIDGFPEVIERGRRALLALRSARAQAAALGASLNLAAQFVSAMIAGPEKKRRI
jgi:hypothetical protein